MTKFWALVGLTFRNRYRVKPTKNGNGGMAGKIVLYVLLAAVFVPVLVFAFEQCLQVGKYFAAVDMYPDVAKYADEYAAVVASMIISVQGITLVFGFAQIIGTVFTAKDGDKLLYMPVGAQTIFAAKFFVAYVSEAVFSTVLLFVTVFPFGIGAGLGAGFYIAMVAALLLVPLLPLALSTLLGMPLSWLIAKLGRNSILQRILSVVVYFVALALYFLLVFGIGHDVAGAVNPDQITSYIAALVKKIGEVAVWVHPDYLTARMFVASDAVLWTGNFVLALVELGVISALMVLAAKAFYGRMLSSSLESGSCNRHSAQGNLVTVTKGGVVRMLMITDLKRTLRDRQMWFQVVGGMVTVPIIVLLSGAVLCFGGGITGRKDFLLLCPIGVMALLTMMTAGINVLGIFPISRENKSLFMLKTLPVSFGKILQAKLLLATLSSLISDLCAMVLAIYVVGVKPLSALLILLGLVLFGFGNTCITTKVDLVSPKIGWDSFQASLKNSRNVWVAMLLGLLSAAMIFAACIPFILFYDGDRWMEYLMFLTVDVIGAAYAYVCYNILRKNAEKSFENIEP